MKKIPLQYLFILTKFSFFGFFLQCFLVSALFANGSDAQIPDAKEIFIDLNVDEERIDQVLGMLEKQTIFNITYTSKELDTSKRVSINVKNVSVYEILKELSRQAHIKFRQVNENLSIQSIGAKEEGLGYIKASFVAFTVTGRVIDETTGEGLPGVTVLVQGTSNGTVTDTEGKYSISVEEGSTLVFSFVGYHTQEVQVEDRRVIDVALAEDVQNLEEVVVVGYGIQEKKEITSAVSSVKAEDFNQGNVNDVAQLLQGKVAGMVISRPGGNPNQGFNIRLRGLSTLGANQQPLVVIDGVIGADLNSVDPNDIASIDVLKDGSAAAIYGTRGSSGVILVTTKTGKPGKTVVDYNSYIAADEIARKVQVMTPEEFLAIGGNDLGSETNWVDEITRTGISHVHNVALSGGTEKTTYRVSLNYRDIQGVAKTTGFDQLNGRINLTQKALNDKLAVTLNLASTVRHQSFGFDQVFQNATLMNPTAPIRSDDPAFEPFGGYYEVFLSQNPVAYINQNTNEGQLKRLNFNIQGDYQIMKGLSFMARYSRNNEDETLNRYLSKYSFGEGNNRNGLARNESITRANQLFETTLTYNKAFERLNMTILGGYSYQEFQNEGFRLEGGNFLTDEFGFNNMSASKDFQDGLATVNSFKNSYLLVAPIFGRINFNYDDTYFFTASARYEGSSRFGANNRWGVFPAVSAGANIANLVTIPGVYDLKARISYGLTGAIPGDSYLSLLRFGPQTNRFFMVNGEYVPVFAPVSNPNPDLKWETKAEINYGLDFSLFKGRLNGSMDYYTRSTKDLIIELPVPVPPNLFPTSILNVGELENSGFEFAANYRAINKPNFSWTPAFNFTTFTTKLVSLSTNDIEYGFRDIANLGSPGQNSTPLIRVEEGRPLGQIWGLVYDGVGEDGGWNWKDVNNDGEITNEDRQVIGNGYPSVELGFNNSFTYRNFDLNIFFRGALGHDLVNTYRAFYEVQAIASTYNVVNTRYFDPNLTGPARFSSHHVEDASFLKLDNAQIGYNLNFGAGKLFSRLRIYAAGQNLIFLTNYTGVDPEVRFTDDGNALAPGIDRRNTWFRTRTYTLGLNVAF